MQNYKAYLRVEKQRYVEGQRPSPSILKAIIPTEWLERYLLSGFYKKQNGQNWTYEKKDDEEFFLMYKSQKMTRDLKRLLTFLREHKISWTIRATRRNAA